MTEENEKRYNDYVKQVNELKWKNMESFHSRLITLSTAALGASLAMYRAEQVQCKIVAYLSWIAFSFTLAAMLTCYFLLRHGLDHHLARTEVYLGDPDNQQYPNIEASPFQRALNVLELLATIAFGAGIVFVVVLLVERGT